MSPLGAVLFGLLLVAAMPELVRSIVWSRVLSDLVRLSVVDRRVSNRDRRLRRRVIYKKRMDPVPAKPLSSASAASVSEDDGYYSNYNPIRAGK